jgi:carbon storage regulator
VLVLSRRIGESVVVGNNVVVTILEVRGDLVRVGIEAPRDVPVHRREVFEAIEAANRLAASPESGAVSALASALSARQRRDQPATPATSPTPEQPDPAAT